ncbi:hypothetical protein FB566_4979 [Stackebrandtia endophytica]|uniref:Uncharacterized protein n=1 Tax=Stackebrandtia endophytica TaxID=1496996 RepID=A0A543B3G5_9ACTN|nr:hypothetical protein FB566_4979 [Stackebrandtia endophytica]
MDIRAVDPGDANRSVDTPVYRVEFWHRGTEAFWSETIEVGGADVTEASAWAVAKSDPEGSTFLLYLAEPTNDGVTLHRLTGSDPTEAVEPSGFGGRLSQES